MGIFDSIAGKLGEHADVGNLAAKLGIDPAVAEQAITALAKAHQGSDDTVATAAAETGIDRSVLSKIVEQIGGEGSLSEFARLLG